MSISRIYSPRTSQPQGAVGVNWANPLAQGLVFEYHAPTGRDTVTGQVLTHENGPTLAPTPQGVGRRFVPASSQAVNLGDPVWVDFGGGDFGFEALFTFNGGLANTTQQMIFGKDALGARQVWLEIQRDDSASHYSVGLVWINGGTVTQQWPAAGTGIPIGTPTHVIFQRRGNSSELWIDGKAITTRNGSAHTGWASVVATATTAYIGRRSYTGNFDYLDGSVLLLRARNRSVSNAEAKALAANPWQLFAPIERSIWVPVTAAGGGVPTLSSLSAINVTTTTAQLRVTVTV